MDRGGDHEHENGDQERDDQHGDIRVGFAKSNTGADKHEDSQDAADGTYRASGLSVGICGL